MLDRGRVEGEPHPDHARRMVLAGSGGTCAQTSRDGYICTKKVGHRGKHAAHGLMRGVLQRWP